MSNQTPHPPVCLLSFDGGGIKGISELLILQHIMVAVKDRLRLTEEPRPCEYFDLVGGTSTGGLITIMLVRLRMTASEALRQYFNLAGKIFSKENKKWKGQDGAFKASTLEASVKAIVWESSNGSRMLPTRDDGTRAKGFVCALAAENMDTPYRLKTYKVPGEISYDCEIWEAARATTAAPTYFKAISIKWPNGSSTRFVDGGLGYNNPTKEVIKEAQITFGASTPLRIIISIGCGVKSSIQYAAPSGFDKFLPKNVAKALKKIALNCEKTSQDLECSFKNNPNIYFRFNIPEIGNIGLAEVEQSTLDRIASSTKAFFNVGNPGHSMLGQVVQHLCEGKDKNRVSNHGITLGRIFTLTEKSKPSNPGYQVVPFPRNKNFVGREFYLEQLIKKLDTTSLDSTCPWVALDGLGGVGKTQIALEAAYQIQANSPECSIFWVQASDTASFNNSYRQIAQKLGIPGLEDDKDVNKLVFEALMRLSSGWVLIIDNADDYEVLLKSNGSDGSPALIKSIPNRGNGAVLFTTRNHRAAVDFTEANVIQIKAMSREESTELLKQSVIDMTPSLLDDGASITDLLDLLLDLPLAIKQAAAYMNKNFTFVSKYLSYYKRSEQEMVEVLSQDFEDHGRYDTQNNPVATTWLISFKQMEIQDPLAAEYLSFIGVILGEDILMSLLPPGNSQLEQNTAIGTLMAYSFLNRRKDGESFDVHRLVHLATRNWLRKDHKISIWEDEALQRLVEVISGSDHSNREVWTRYLPHGIRLADSTKVSSANKLDMIKLLHKIGQCQNSIGQYVESAKMHQRSLAISEDALGKEHPDTLASRNELGEALRSQGKYAVSEEMHRETLMLREKISGKEHPDTLTSMGNLASTYRDQGRWNEAEELDIQVLEIRKRVLGQEHPDTLMSMGNLANTYWNQGRWNEAEDLQIQVLEIRKRVLGQEHPDTLMSMNNLASTYWNQGRWNKAEDLEIQVLEVSKRVLGQEHPATLTSINNLASTYWNQGRWNKAEELEIQILEIRKRVLGQEHPETLTSMANLAHTYKSQGRDTEALELMSTCLEISERKLGAEHPDTMDRAKSCKRWKGSRL